MWYFTGFVVETLCGCIRTLHCKNSQLVIGKCFQVDLRWHRFHHYWKNQNWIARIPQTTDKFPSCPSVSVCVRVLVLLFSGCFDSCGMISSSVVQRISVYTCGHRPSGVLTYTRDQLLALRLGRSLTLRFLLRSALGIQWHSGQRGRRHRARGRRAGQEFNVGLRHCYVTSTSFLDLTTSDYGHSCFVLGLN